jgi:hypothetical protein
LFPCRNNPLQRFGERYGHYFVDNEFLGRSALGNCISIAQRTAANISKSGKAYEIEVVAPGFDKEGHGNQRASGHIDGKSRQKSKAQFAGKRIHHARI